MNKFTRASRTVGAAALLQLLCVFPGLTFGSDDKPQAEILHWWSSAGERAALEVFIDAYEARGGYFYDSTTNNQSSNYEEAIERLSKGYPPTLTQWNAGWYVQEFYQYGLIDAIKDPDLLSKLRESVPKAILDSVSNNDKIVALPINIHSENWMWYSTDLVKHTDTMLAGDWNEFSSLGEKLEQQGIPLLAVGDQSWQVRILFTSLLLGVSRDAYKSFYLSTDDAIVDHEDFHQTLTTFNQLAKFSQSFGDGNWNTQVKAVADNQAGATFMGDWAKGEFQVLGKNAGAEYGCTLTASNDPSLLLVIDSFILGKVTEEKEKEGQALMLDVVSDPQVNLQFNAVKGSVSPYIKPSADQLDVCSSQVYQLLPDNEAVIPPYASYMHAKDMNKIDNAIYDFWKASSRGQAEDDKALVAETINKFRDILKEINTDTDLPQATNEVE